MLLPQEKTSKRSEESSEFKRKCNSVRYMGRTTNVELLYVILKCGICNHPHSYRSPVYSYLRFGFEGKVPRNKFACRTFRCKCGISCIAYCSANRST